MRKLLTALFAALPLVTFLAPASAKTVNATSFIPWIGTWSCISGKDRYTETFTPVLNAKAMRVSVTGPYASEGVAVYDPARKAWFYAFVNGDGSYSANTGPVKGATIAFKQIFPPGVANDTIALNSPRKYSSSFTMVANHKTVTAREVCTKN